MARYIKVTPKIAKYLGLAGVRNKLKDGNYLLWQADMLQFGPLTSLTSTLLKIGAVSLTPEQAKQEQDGKLTTVLPEPVDSQFKDSDSEPAAGTTKTKEV